jgi:peptidoglycan/LPS O-acetylase OafA/YrhL
LAWAGTEAVYAFFVLSGFVLTLPFLMPDRPDWKHYFVHRFARLYLPIWAGAALSYAIFWWFPRHAGSGVNDWLQLHAGQYSSTHLLYDLAIFFGTSPILNTAYWSLQWEL